MYLQAGPTALANLPAKPANIDANTVKIPRPPMRLIISCHETKREEKGLSEPNRLCPSLEDCWFFFSLFNQLLTWLISRFPLCIDFFLLNLFYWSSRDFSLLFLFRFCFLNSSGHCSYKTHACVATQLYRGQPTRCQLELDRQTGLGLSLLFSFLFCFAVPHLNSSLLFGLIFIYLLLVGPANNMDFIS